MLLLYVVAVGENQNQRLAQNTIMESNIICLSNQNTIN